MPKLNQIIALEKGVKSRSYANLTEAHQQLQKAALLAGISRTYRPRDDEGERYPPESTRVQVRAEEVVQRSATILGELFDVVATKDWSNCAARADVVVDGKLIIAQVPVTHLVEIDYRDDVRAAHRVVPNGRYLYIRGLQNVDERNVTWQLSCEERVQ